jgi:hypothetical protein
MAGGDHEQRSKQCQETRGSSSNWALSTHPKKLAKRVRPSSFHEDYSPEDSPPRGSTPNSLEEFECLKIRASETHTNRDVINYNEDLRNIVTLCDKPCYSSARRGAWMRGSRYSFINIGTIPCSIGRPL